MTQLLLAEQLKTEGIERVESHNEDFVEMMRETARMIVADRGSVTSDDLRKWADSLGLVPKHPNAIGAVFATDEWKSIGFVRSTRAAAHRRWIQRWSLK